MTDLGTTTRAPEPAPTRTPDGESGRTVSRRRSLPGGRAVVGAFLITAAAVGVFAAYLNATAAPSSSYLVATEAIAPGTRVTAEMVESVPIDLPPDQAERALSSPDRVVDRVALGPVRAGDLLTGSTFLAPETPQGTTTFTFAVPAARALGGAIAAGDRIDVLATYGDFTAFVTRDVPVLTATAPSGASSGVLITVALEEPDTVLALAHAIDSAQIHVARTDPDVDGDGPSPFVAPAAES